MATITTRTARSTISMIRGTPDLIAVGEDSMAVVEVDVMAAGADVVAGTECPGRVGDPLFGSVVRCFFESPDGAGGWICHRVIKGDGPCHVYLSARVLHLESTRKPTGTRAFAGGFQTVRPAMSASLPFRSASRCASPVAALRFGKSVISHFVVRGSIMDICRGARGGLQGSYGSGGMRVSRKVRSVSRRLLLPDPGDFPDSGDFSDSSKRAFLSMMRSLYSRVSPR